MGLSLRARAGCCCWRRRLWSGQQCVQLARRSFRFQRPVGRPSGRPPACRELCSLNWAHKCHQAPAGPLERRICFQVMERASGALAARVSPRRPPGPTSGSIHAPAFSIHSPIHSFARPLARLHCAGPLSCPATRGAQVYLIFLGNLRAQFRKCSPLFRHRRRRRRKLSPPRNDSHHSELPQLAARQAF